MNTYPRNVTAFFIGLYAWLITASLGMVLQDIQYASQAPLAVNQAAEGADFLLGVGFFVFLAAFVALAFCWNMTTVRTFLLASLIVYLLEFVIPVLVSVFAQSAPGLSISPWARILINAAASILAFVGMYHFFNQDETDRGK